MRETTRTPQMKSPWAPLFNKRVHGNAQREHQPCFETTHAAKQESGHIRPIGVPQDTNTHLHGKSDSLHCRRVGMRVRARKNPNTASHVKAKQHQRHNTGALDNVWTSPKSSRHRTRDSGPSPMTSKISIRSKGIVRSQSMYLYASLNGKPVKAGWPAAKPGN